MSNGNILLGGRPARISMSAAVASDLTAFQKGLGLVAERLGHPKCFSGIDCTFMNERTFMLNDAEEIQALGEANLASGGEGSVTRGLTLSPEISYDIGKIQDLVAKVAAQNGCEACCSGYDIAFRQELDFIVDADLNVHSRSLISSS